MLSIVSVSSVLLSMMPCRYFHVCILHYYIDSLLIWRHQQKVREKNQCRCSVVGNIMCTQMLIRMYSAIGSFATRGSYCVCVKLSSLMKSYIGIHNETGFSFEDVIFKRNNSCIVYIFEIFAIWKTNKRKKCQKKWNDHSKKWVTFNTKHKNRNWSAGLVFLMGYGGLEKYV